jgi:hypothetical protein
MTLEFYEVVAIESGFIRTFSDKSASFGKQPRKVLLCTAQRSLLGKVLGRVVSTKRQSESLRNRLNLRDGRREIPSLLLVLKTCGLM